MTRLLALALVLLAGPASAVECYGKYPPPADLPRGEVWSHAPYFCTEADAAKEAAGRPHVTLEFNQWNGDNPLPVQGTFSLHCDEGWTIVELKNSYGNPVKKCAPAGDLKDPQ